MVKSTSISGNIFEIKKVIVLAQVENVNFFTLIKEPYASLKINLTPIKKAVDTATAARHYDDSHSTYQLQIK